MDPMAAIKRTFVQECEEQLAELEAGLLAMEAGKSNSETVNAVFRAVHSIKGSTGPSASMTSSASRMSSRQRSTMSVRVAWLRTPDVLKIKLRAADVLADLVRAARDGTTVDEARCKSLADELRALDPNGGEEKEDDLSTLNFQPVLVRFEGLDDDDDDDDAEEDTAPIVVPLRWRASLHHPLPAAAEPLRQSE